VYIPTLEGYFAHGLEILQLCLNSLYCSCQGAASITVVANGAAPQVIQALQSDYDAGKLDQLILNQQNRGKVDAVVSIARGCHEELITITDCDVLFKPQWIAAIEALFQQFPECGFASPFPNPLTAWYHTSATVLASALRRELALAKVIPDEDLDQFARSIGQPQLYKPEHRAAHMVVKRNGAIACVGSGHFVFTIRKEVVDSIPRQPSLKTVSNDSEEQWLDIPPDRSGFWRLSTARAYAYHMGNTPEPWMYERSSEVATELPAGRCSLPRSTRSSTAALPLKLRRGLVRVMRKPIFKKLIFI
jgi:hypothetical protein